LLVFIKNVFFCSLYFPSFIQQRHILTNMKENTELLCIAYAVRERH
jgi:hypothetical protein